MTRTIPRIAILLSLFIIFLHAASPSYAAPAFTFVHWSDTNSGLTTHGALATKAKSLNPAFSLFAGDMLNDGVDNPVLTSWQNALGSMAPISFAVRGNHDTHFTGSLEAFNAFFNQAAKVSSIGATNYNSPAAGNNASYSFDYNGAHFVGLDIPGGVSLANSDAALMTWLENDMTAAEKRCIYQTFLFYHGPTYCFGGAHCYTDTNNANCTQKHCAKDDTYAASIIKVLNKHPSIVATLNGHEHIYGHTYVDNTRLTTLTHPFYEILPGTAGGDLRVCNANRCDFSLSAYGFILYTVTDKTTTAQFYKYASGNFTIADTFSFTTTYSPPSGACTGTTPTPTPSASPAAKIGDASGDGRVDLIDYSIWLNFYNQTVSGGRLQGDFNTSGKVDLIDYSLWLNNYNN